MPRRYLAVHLPWLPAESALIRGIAPPDAPFALVEKAKGALRIVALSRAAAVLGLAPGLPLADARARVPELATLAFDAQGDAERLAGLLALGRRYTPSVAVDPPCGLLLDIAGCVHRFAAGEAGLLSDLLARLRERGLSARTGLADTPDAARALARFGGEDVRALSVAALELDEDAHIALQRAGLRRIGDLAALPRAALAARFGVALPLRLARLLGEEDAHITPAAVIAPVTAELRFAEPIGRVDDVLDAAEALVAQAASTLERRGEGGRAFVVRLHRSDGHVARLLVETGAPTRDPALVLRLLAERIESLADPLDPGFGYDSVDLAVPLAEPLAERQAMLDGAEEATDGMAPLLDRLAVRHGQDSLRQCRAGDSHVPERAGWLGTVVEGAGTGAGAGWNVAGRPADPPLRPLVLLDSPQRVEVIAAVPDGPPRRFRWQGHMHRIVRQEGPERIAPEWWRRRDGHDANPGRTRDYYRVEDDAGHRFWLFRHGLYGMNASPDWYVHGLFG